MLSRLGGNCKATRIKLRLRIHAATLRVSNLSEISISYYKYAARGRDKRRGGARGRVVRVVNTALDWELEDGGPACVERSARGVSLPREHSPTQSVAAPHALAGRT